MTVYKPINGDLISVEELKKHAFKVSECVFEDETNDFVVSLSTINKLLQQTKRTEDDSDEQLKKLDRINSTIEGLDLIKYCAKEKTYFTTTLAGIDLENKAVIVENTSLDSFLFGIDRAIQHLKDMKRREENEHGC